MIDPQVQQRLIAARRELHELAGLVASSSPRVDIERTLRVLHPRATSVLAARELAAIVALATRPLRGRRWSA